MRSKTLTVALLTSLVVVPMQAHSLDTTAEENACQEIGFKQKNPQFGECVLELLQRRRAALRAKKYDAPIPYKASPARPDSNNLWDMKLIVASPNTATYLVRPDRSVFDTIRIQDMRSVVDVVNNIGSSAKISPKLYIRESDEINAGATFYNGQPIIFINKPLYDLLAKDRDMTAALVGHEIAHLYLRHPGATSGTDAIGGVLGLIAGVALEIVARQKLGVADIGFDSGQMLGKAFSTSFTRDQEREADRLGIQWMKINGYDPSGAVRLFAEFEKRQGNTLLPFFQTHPNPEERMQNAQKEVLSK